MRDLGFSRQNGASVVEMLIILVVIGILVTFAVSQFGRSSSSFERQNIAREFKISLERARFDSVKRRASRCEDMSRVVITGPRAFQVVTDQNQNGTIMLDNGTPGDTTDDVPDTSEIRTINFAGRGDIGIVGVSTYPVVIRFDERGNTSSGTCATPTATVPVTTFCNMPCTSATVNAQNASSVFVSPTGTTAMMLGGQTVPTFLPPTVSNINSSNMIDNRLTIWVGPPPTPTPFPSTTPPTPTPLPPVGTPNPTVTPTPTPNACAYNQNPYGSPPCTCIAPMYIVTNPSGNNPRCVGPTTTPTP